MMPRTIRTAVLLFWAAWGLAAQPVRHLDFHGLHQANQGEAQLAAGNYAEAVDTLNAGYAATSHAVISAAGYLRERERYDEALDILNRRAWRTWDGFWFVRFVNAVGQTLSEAGRHAEAADVYRLLAEADESRADGNARNAAAVQWGRMLIAAGHLADARNVFYELLTVRDDLPEPLWRQAEALLAELSQPQRDDEQEIRYPFTCIKARCGASRFRLAISIQWVRTYNPVVGNRSQAKKRFF